MIQNELQTNKCLLVRQTCHQVHKQSRFVKIDQTQLEEFVQSLNEEMIKGYQYIDFNSYSCHFSDMKDQDLILDYLFVLDTLNFCFWPNTQNWEYDNLAGALQSLIAQDSNVFKPENLIQIDREWVQKNIFNDIEFPLLNERTRVLQELGQRTLEYFQGNYLNILKSANKSAVKLLDLLTSTYCNFQDLGIYQGEQIFFYKRSQILIADIFAAFQGKGHGEFIDIKEVTMFPDYRVPQILNHYKVMVYNQELEEKINNKTQLKHGCDEEIEIRAATVEAVEQIKRQFFEKYKRQFLSVEIDWILWQKGEEMKDSIVPHHRVKSIFY